MSNRDARWMEIAFAQARAARGSTLPNPSVGAAVFDAGGRLLSAAATSPPGGPHAEVRVLAAAGQAAEGGTLVTTLEPCVAFPGKRTPPCAAQVLQAGISRVIVGCTDPHPHVAGRGVRALRAGGVVVVSEDLRGAVSDFYQGWGMHCRCKRPRTTLKVAISANGCVAASAGTRTRITSAESDAWVHELRSVSDHILVGASTVLIDDPHLDVRHVEGPSPRPLVLAGRSPLPFHRKLLRPSPRGAVVLGPGPRPDLLAPDVEWVELPASSDGRPSPHDVLEWCGSCGAHDLLVETGPSLLGSFLRHEAWDRLVVIRGSTQLPGGVQADPERQIPTTIPNEEFSLGPDLVRIWHRTPSRPQAGTPSS